MAQTWSYLEALGLRQIHVTDYLTPAGRHVVIRHLDWTKRIRWFMVLRVKAVKPVPPVSWVHEYADPMHFGEIKIAGGGRP